MRAPRARSRRWRRRARAHRVAVPHPRLGNAPQAAAEWTAFLKDFDASPHAPSAALGLGRAYLLLGRARDAREMFSRVEEKWADSKEAPLAVFALGESWQ